MKTYYNVPMGNFSTIGVGAKARRFTTVDSVEEIKELSISPSTRIIGNGSNILALNDITHVIKLGPFFPAAQSVHNLCKANALKGQAGLEFLMGIPATLGGAIKTNAGGKHGSMSDVVESVSVLKNGKVKNIIPKFSYRSSNIDGIVLDAKLKTTKDDPQNILKRMKSIHSEKLQSQPLSAKTAGCIFKNPAECPASSLIDQCHLKGKNFNGVRTSDLHANFLIADKNSSPENVMDAIRKIQEIVFEKKGINLELEIEVWDG